MKLSDWIFERIAAAGVKTVFLVPGGGAMHLNDSLGRNRSLEWVGTLHEQASTIDPERLRGFDPEELTAPRPAAPLSDQVAKVIVLLEKAERPALLVGNGVRAARAQKELRALVERLGVPVLATWLSFDMIP